MARSPVRGPRSCAAASGLATGKASDLVRPARAASAAGVLRLALALGGGELLELLLAHRFGHLLRRALELRFGRVAALGGEGGAGGLLLRFGFGRHGLSP